MRIQRKSLPTLTAAVIVVGSGLVPHEVSRAQATDGELQVLLARPNTENVIDVQQITVTFNKTMVPLGDYEKLAAGMNIQVSPAVNCQWRWLNASTIACQLDKALPLSNRYKITIPAGIKALDGSVLKSAKTETFSTLSWTVERQNIEFRGPDVPRIHLTFNQAMDLASLRGQANSECGKLRIEKADPKEATELEVDVTRTYRFEYEKPVGIGKNCSITVAAAARATSGPLTSKEFTYSFTSFPEFRVKEVRCYREIYGKAVNPKQYSIESCDPDSGVSIEFTAPSTGANLAGRIKTAPEFGWSSGGEGSPEHYKQYGDQEFHSVYLRSPMKGASQHKITLDGVRDRFGRTLQGPNEVVVKTSDFSPILQLPDGYGVLEKGGPLQLAVSGVNAKDVDLRYFHSRSADDVKMWSTYIGCPNRKGVIEPEFIYNDKMKSAVIPTNAALNQAFLSPIDLSKVAPDFKYGMFVGKMLSARELSGSPFDAHAVCSNIFTVVTDLGILAKTGFFDSGIWVHSIKTGAPMKNVKVTLASNFRKIAEGKTDDNGFFAMPGAVSWDPERQQFGYGYRSDKLYFIAETTDDFSVLPFEAGRRGLEAYEFGVPSNLLTASTNHIIHAITDRPLYKPGQKVNVKLFARHWEARTYGLKPAKEVRVEVFDALEKSIFKKTLKLSEFGTADFSFDLDGGTSLGAYSIRAEADKYSTQAGQFDVQVFTLPVFKVTAESRKPIFEVGESANFETKTRYHFGGGVPNAKGEYNVLYTGAYYRPKTPKWQSFTFENTSDVNIVGFEKPRTVETKTVGSGNITTDKNGDASVGILLPNNEIKSYGKIEYGVAFKDDRGKSIGGYSAAEVFYSRYLVGLKTPEWVYEAQKTITPDVVVLDPTEKPINGVDVELKLVHRTYKTVRNAGAGSYFYYSTRSKDREIARCAFKTNDSMKGCALKPEAAGDHYLIATVRDPRGRTSQASIQKYVTGKDYVGWYRENHDRIDVIPEKREYTKGETAKFLIKNPYQEVDALITLERFGILRQFRRKLTKGAELISVPLDAADLSPGFTFSVQLIKGRVSEKIEGGVDLGKPSFKMGMTQIKVVDPDTVLKVETKSDRQAYEPGEQTQVTLAVDAPSGREVAELSVAVVDEKILQLAGDYEGRYQLHNKFQSVPGLDVETSQMLSFIIGRRHFGKKGAPAGGDGDSSSPVRKNILPLAYWNPTVRTDASGKASVKFSLPDNLTTWRVLVVAVDKKHRFGFGTQTFRAAKKVMIEPALPSFLTEGDKFNSRFTVFNRTGANSEFDGRIKVDGVTLASPAEKKLNVANDGKGYLEWPLSVPFGKTNAMIEVSANAAAAKASDAVRENIPIYPFASYETFANYGSTTNAKVTEAIEIPKGVRAELSTLDVLVSPTLISHLDDSFRYLFRYPYTCWEQTLTRAISLSQYMRLKQYLSIDELSREPGAWAKELLGEMSKFQYANGGMAYWKADSRTVDHYLTVYTALGIQWTEAAGVKPPAAQRKLLFDYVRRLTQGKEKMDDRSRASATVLAMAAHVLAQEGDNVVPIINKLYQERAKLSLFGKSFLWQAAAKFPATKSLLGQIKNEIYSAADLTSGSIQFKEQADDGLVWILHSTTRTNCNLLSAMMTEDPNGKFVEPLVRWIIAGRKSNRWNNTQENLYCQNALAQYAAHYEKETPNYTLSSRAFDKALKPVTFRSFKEKPQAERVGLAPEVVGKRSSVTIEKNGPGRVYYTARLRIAYQTPRTDGVNSGMQVARTYFTKGPGGKWLKQDNVVRLKRGETVKVLLKVKIPAVRNQVVLDDRLPAGLEPVNTALGGSSKTDAAAGESNNSAGETSWSEDDDWYGYYSSGGFYHREMKLHSVQYFANFMSAGDYEMSYVAQAIATGEFNANPALIEQMYEPEVYGKSAPARFIITE